MQPTHPEVNPPLADMFFAAACGMNLRRAEIMRSEPGLHQPETLAARDHEAPTGSETPRRVRTLAELLEGKP